VTRHQLQQNCTIGSTINANTYRDEPKVENMPPASRDDSKLDQENAKIVEARKEEIRREETRREEEKRLDEKRKRYKNKISLIDLKGARK
jgi:hypothetical protein